MNGLDEIKARLEAEIAESRAKEWRPLNERQHDMRRLIARVERLEKALDDIGGYTAYLGEARHLARTALAEEDGE